MSKLEELTDDLAKIREAAKVYNARYKGMDYRAMELLIESQIEAEKRKAAQTEPTDPWKKARDYLDWRRTEQNHPGLDSVIAWVDFLAKRNEELEEELAARPDAAELAKMAGKWTGAIDPDVFYRFGLGLPTGFVDSNNAMICVGDIVKAEATCNKTIHGDWANWAVELRGTIPVLVYMGSEKPTKLAPGSLMRYLTDSYDSEAVFFKTDLRKAMPIHHIEIVGKVIHEP